MSYTIRPLLGSKENISFEVDRKEQPFRRALSAIGLFMIAFLVIGLTVAYLSYSAPPNLRFRALPPKIFPPKPLRLEINNHTNGILRNVKVYLVVDKAVSNREKSTLIRTLARKDKWGPNESIFINYDDITGDIEISCYNHGVYRLSKKDVQDMVYRIITINGVPLVK